MRGQFFGFGSRLSSDSNNNGLSVNNSNNSSGYIRRHAFNEQFSASQAASEEQGNSSMCSFDGFCINITEEQLN